MVVGILALIVFGPQKLPEMARSLGKGLSQLKQIANDAKSEFDSGMDVDPEATPTTSSPVSVSERVVE